MVIEIDGAGSGTSEADAAKIAPDEDRDEREEPTLNISTFARSTNRQFKLPRLSRSGLVNIKDDLYDGDRVN